MMKKMLMAVVAIAFIACIAPQVGAQGLQEVKLGPVVGYHKAQGADDGKFMGGAMLRFKLTPGFGVEGSVNYRQEKFNDGALTVRSWPVTASALIYPLPMLYGAIGAGWYNTTYEVEATGVDETNQETGWHFGGGVEVPIATSVKLTGDFRYVFLNYDFDDVPVVEVDRDFYVITAGFLFGL